MVPAPVAVSSRATVQHRLVLERGARALTAQYSILKRISSPPAINTQYSIIMQCPVVVNMHFVCVFTYSAVQSSSCEFVFASVVLYSSAMPAPLE